MDRLGGVLSGSEIITDNGNIVRIEDVSVGDRLIGHDGGYVKVSAHFKRPYSGTYIVLDTLEPFGKVRISPTQAVLVFPHMDDRDPLRRTHTAWVAGGSLEPGMFLLSPWAAVLKNSTYKAWVLREAGQIIQPDKYTTGLGIVHKVTRIAAMEETELTVHRLLLEKGLGYIAGGAAVKAV